MARARTFEERTHDAPTQLTVRTFERRLWARHCGAERCGVIATLPTPRAELLQRADLASRRRSTELRTKVKHRLIECGHIFSGQEFLRQDSSLVLTKSAIGERSRQYSPHVGIQHCHPFTEGK
jgi:hypothetical protein